MKSFNVIWYDFNGKTFKPYNVIPYFVDEYERAKKKPKTFDEFKEFIKSNSMYMYWSRCQYEMILSDWPSSGVQEKWDIHKQIMMNLDIVTNLLIESV